MVHYSSFACLVLTALVLGLFDVSHQAPYHPYFNPFYNPYHDSDVQPRFNFNVNTLLVRTMTTTSTTIVTATTTLTCTRSTTACTSDAASNTNRFPFYNGIAKRSIEEKQLADIFASQVESVEATQVPDSRVLAPRSSDSELILTQYPIYEVESSMAREIQPANANQARLFIGTTTTIVITQTSLSTTTRTLTPSCSLAGFFSQCT